MEPKLRIKGFSGAWSKKSIGEILKFKNGLNKDKDAFGHGTPIINYTDVYHHRGLTKQIIKGKVKLGYDELKRYRVKKGDVFFTRTSETPEEVGFASVLLDEVEDCSFSGFILRGRPYTDDLFIDFCKECFSVKSVRDAIISTSTCTTRALTNGTLLSKILINFPSKDEQKAVASFFTKIDSIISASTSRLTALKQMKTASLQAMFPQENEMTPRVRFRGFYGEWKKCKLEDCLSICLERNTEEEFGKEQVLSVSDEEGVVNQIQLLGRSFAGKSVSNYKILKPNQIVYTKSPLKAKPFGIVKVNKGVIGIVSVLYAVYDAKDNVCPDYIHYYFEPHYRINKYLSPLVNKGAKNTMNISDEMALQGSIYIPTYDEQIKIAEYLKAIDKLITLQSKRLEKLKQIKSACLDKMFV